MRQRPSVFLPNFVHKSKLFLAPSALPSALLPFLLVWCNQSSMMLVRYLRAPCCPPSPEFSNPSIFKKKKNSTHLLAPPSLSSLLGSGKVAKKFPLPLDFHNRSHTSSAQTQKSVDPESKVQLVSKWKMSFRKFLIAAAAAIRVKGERRRSSLLLV